MNKVNGKWVSDAQHKTDCQQIMAATTSWIFEVMCERQVDMLEGRLNSMCQTVSTMGREIERIEKIAAMKEANQIERDKGQNSGRIEVVWTDEDSEQDDAEA